MRHRLPWLPLFALGSIPAAQAASFCVDNATDLQIALVAASTNGDSSNTIRLVQGNYTLGGKELYFHGNNTPGSLSVLGGYNNTSCTLRTVNPANTVLNGNAANGAFVDFTSTTRLNLTVEGLRFTQLLPGANGTDGVSFDLTHPDSRLTFRYNQVDGVNAGGAALHVKVGGRADVIDNRITLNLSPRALLVDSNDPTQGARIAYNTIADNANYGVSLYGAWYRVPTALYANVVWNHPGADIEFNGLHTDAYGLANTYGKLGVAGGAVGFLAGSADNTTADPLLDAGYRLGAGSPAINRGAVPHFLVPGQDLDGGARARGSAPDRGAYETTANDVSIYSVTSAADSGPGTLRQAIGDANAAGTPARIVFAIGASCGPQVITLNSALPAITVPMVIDGYSQPGASMNTLTTGFDANLCVMLVGNLVNPVAVGLGTGNSAQARLDVGGLIFGNFNNSALSMSAGTAHYIHGNSFGVVTPGSGALPANKANVIVTGTASSVQIGGGNKVERNLIGNASDPAGYGVTLAADDAFSFVMGNYIGTDAGGTNGAGNTWDGVRISSSRYNQVLNNVIADNGSYGINLIGTPGVTALYTLVQGNRIGQNANGDSLPNGKAAVLATAGAAFNMIGAASDASESGGNAISAESGSWVWIDPTAGTGNLVRTNAITPGVANAGGDAIDLGAVGHEANDAGDADSGPNDLQNSPVLQSVALTKPDELVIDGSLPVPAGGPRYRIDVYWNGDCLPSGYGATGQWLGGALTPLPPPDGNLVFHLTLNGFSAPANGIISATATPTDKLSNATSEVSNCVEMGPDYIFQDGFE